MNTTRLLVCQLKSHENHGLNCRDFALDLDGSHAHYRYISNMLVDSIFYGNNEAESALSDRPGARPRKLPWCETEEDHEAAMADLAAQDSRWS